MRYQSCRLLSPASAQHATSALSLTAGCQWPTTWRQSVAQHSITCARLDPHCSLSRDAAKTLVHAFIFSRLDYCNSVLYGVADKLLQRLQSVQNAAAVAVNTSHLFCRSFDVAGPRLWNKLPASLRSSDSLCQFRRQLETFLFVKD